MRQFERHGNSIRSGRFFLKAATILSLAFGSIVLLSGCSGKEIFSEFHSFPHSSWLRGEVVNFEVPVSDSIQPYDVFLEIRNTDDYPFRNLWLFVDITAPNGELREDTINIELADIYGKWYGKGVSLYIHSVAYDENIHYPFSGNYTYSVRQGMREEVLKGISDIGLTISKHAHQ
jgi:gliding motility-associated lipoprotein GldH